MNSRRSALKKGNREWALTAVRNTPRETPNSDDPKKCCQQWPSPQEAKSFAQIRTQTSSASSDTFTSLCLGEVIQNLDDNHGLRLVAKPKITTGVQKGRWIWWRI